SSPPCRSSLTHPPRPRQDGPFPVSPVLQCLPCLALALGSFSCPCVCFGSLSSHWQSPPVPKPTIAPDVDETFDVHRHFLAKVSLHLVFPLDDLAQLHDLIFAQILHAC